MEHRREGIRVSWVRRTSLAILIGLISLTWHADAALALTSGGGVFNASGVLPQMPCDRCALDAAGSMSVTIEGLDVSGSPYEAVWPDPTVSTLGANLTATIVYSDSCGPTAGAPPSIMGTAVGTFETSDGLLIRGSSVLHGVTLSGAIGWSRVAGVLSLDISATNVYDTSGTLVATTANPGIPLLDGAGLGVYAPSTWLGTCTTFATSVDVELTGALTETF